MNFRFWRRRRRPAWVFDVCTCGHISDRHAHYVGKCELDDCACGYFSLT